MSPTSRRMSTSQGPGDVRPVRGRGIEDGVRDQHHAELGARRVLLHQLARLLERPVEVGPLPGVAVARDVVDEHLAAARRRGSADRACPCRKVNIFSSAATRFSSGSSGGSDAELSIRKRITGSLGRWPAAAEAGGRRGRATAAAASAAGTISASRRTPSHHGSPIVPALQPLVAVVEDGQRGAVTRRVVVVPQRAEQRLDAAPAHAAEDVRQLARFLRLRPPGVGQGLRAGDRGRHREQLVGHVHQAEQERLLVLQAGLVDEHPVEARAGELAAHPLHEAQVGGQAAELRVARPAAPAQPARRDTTTSRRTASSAARPPSAPAWSAGRPWPPPPAGGGPPSRGP